MPKYLKAKHPSLPVVTLFIAHGARGQWECVQEYNGWRAARAGFRRVLDKKIEDGCWTIEIARREYISYRSEVSGELVAYEIDERPGRPDGGKE